MLARLRYRRCLALRREHMCWVVKGGTQQFGDGSTELM
jgi:hypothetical protein